MSEIALDTENVNAFEEIIEPELPIIDAHHHLWFQSPAVVAYLKRDDGLMTQGFLPVLHDKSRYLFDEFLADLNTGHDVRATVYVQVNSMYKRYGPVELRSVGEVEFANGMAAIAASGAITNRQICAAIIGSIDLRIGDGVEAVLEAHLQAGGGRYRGVRPPAVTFDSSGAILTASNGSPGLLADAQFRVGLHHVAKFGLNFEVFLLQDQLPELISTARDFPGMTIVVNHLGGIVGVGPYQGQQESRFTHWRKHIIALAAFPNVVMKLGGLGMPTAGFKTHQPSAIRNSITLAEDWRPYIETCIEAFGVNRCLFESNYPVDSATCSYPVLWNAFKRVTQGASADEKSALFAGTAARIYHISL